MAKRNIKISLGGGDRDKVLNLANTTSEKNKVLNDESPLKTINMTTFNSLLDVASEKCTLMKNYEGLYEKAKAENDLAMGIAKGQTMSTPGTLLYYLGLIRDQLLITYKGREELIGEWGFDVTITESKSMKPRGSNNNTDEK